MPKKSKPLKESHPNDDFAEFEGVGKTLAMVLTLQEEVWTKHQMWELSETVKRIVHSAPGDPEVLAYHEARLAGFAKDAIRAGRLTANEEKNGKVYVSRGEILRLADSEGYEVPQYWRRFMDEAPEPEAQRADAQPEEDAAPRFPTPAGATWDKVHIQFLDGHTVEVIVGSEKGKGKYIYAELGDAFVNRRGHAMPSQQWIMLKGFAEDIGSAYRRPDDLAQRRCVKTTVSRLRTALRNFFGIDADPMPWNAREKVWEAAFKIEPEKERRNYQGYM